MNSKNFAVIVSFMMPVIASPAWAEDGHITCPKDHQLVALHQAVKVRPWADYLPPAKYVGSEKPVSDIEVAICMPESGYKELQDGLTDVHNATGSRIYFVIRVDGEVIPQDFDKLQINGKLGTFSAAFKYLSTQIADKFASDIADRHHKISSLHLSLYRPRIGGPSGATEEGGNLIFSAPLRDNTVGGVSGYVVRVTFEKLLGPHS